MTSLPSIIISLALCGFLATCTSANPSYCDQTRQCLPDSFCDLNAVVDGTELTNSCVAKPSPDACNLATPCPDDKICSDDSIGVCVGCLQTSDCEGTELCDTEVSECIQSCEQTSEGDEFCAGLDEGEKPRCGEEGRCVACLGADDCTQLTAAVCEDFSCRGCETHQECKSQRCALETGTCFDESTILYVSINGTDQAGCGVQLQPCRTIGNALSKVDGTLTTLLVSEGIYSEHLSVSGTTVRIIGEGNVKLTPGLNSETAFHIGADGVVTIENLQVQPNSSASGNIGIECDAGAGQSSLSATHLTVENVGGQGIAGTDCNIDLSQSSVHNNTELGIEVSGGVLRLHRSTIQDNDGGGISVESGDYDIVNNFITGNGNSDANGSLVGGVRFTATSGLSEAFSFNTLTGNATDSGTLGGSALSCSDTELAGLGNIIVLGGGGGGLGLTAGTCTSTYSLIQGDFPAAGIGNIIGNPGFADPVLNDYHISSQSPCHDAADEDATLAVDFDGHERPQGEAHDMGADEVQE